MRKTRKHFQQHGFTIVELLIVVVVIGVLAAITIVTFSGIIRQAEISRLQLELNNAGKSIEVHRIENGAYPEGADVVGIKSSDSIEYGYIPGAQNFCLQGILSKYDIEPYRISDGGSVEIGACPTTVASCFQFNPTNFSITRYYNYENDLSGNPACPKSVVIPSSIDGIAVRAIANSAFSNRHITSVLIPNSVLTLGSGAFSNNQITSIRIPSSVTSIGPVSFASNRLTSLVIPDSVTTIGVAAFNSNQLTTVDIGASVTTIGDSAFSGNQLRTVTIPNSVTAIAGSAFMGNSLTSVTLGNSVATIGGSAFSSNPLSSITIPASVVSIGIATFDSAICHVPTGRAYYAVGCTSYTYY